MSDIKHKQKLTFKVALEKDPIRTLRVMVLYFT